MNWIFTALSFFLPFGFYLAGLAPSVTLEDSGELITAASQWGVPHPPGYPLFTLMGNIWVRILPFEPAYSMNLFSALTSALSGLVLFKTIMLSLNLLKNESSELEKQIYFNSIFSLGGSLLATLAPHYFRQSVITEVYGLHNFLWSSFFYVCMRILLIRSHFDGRKGVAQRFKFLFILSIGLFGLGMSNHHLMMVGGFLLLFIFFVLFKFFCWKTLIIGGLVFLGSLSPYVYLPLASNFQPSLYWGEPKTLQSFVEVIGRSQYRPHFYRDPIMLVEQLREQVILLLSQYPLFLLIVGLIGLGYLFLTKRSIGAFFLIALISTGPLTTVLLNFELPLLSREAYNEVTALMSVFFLPHYQIWAILVVVGFFRFFLSIQEWIRVKKISWVLGVCIISASLFWGLNTYQKESKKNDLFAWKLYKNIDRISEGKPTLVLVNWDPFSFPGIYFQKVLGLFPHLWIVDIEMMKGGWYLRELSQWYPLLAQRIAPEVQDYLRHEKQKQQDIKVNLWPSYEKMIAALIEKNIDDHLIFLMTDRDYLKFPIQTHSPLTIESVIVAGRLKRPGDGSLAINLEQLDLSGFDSGTVAYDRLHQMLAKYYARLLFERSQFEKNQNEELSQLLSKQALQMQSMVKN